MTSIMNRVAKNWHLIKKIIAPKSIDATTPAKIGGNPSPNPNEFTGSLILIHNQIIWFIYGKVQKLTSLLLITLVVLVYYNYMLFPLGQITFYFFYLIIYFNSLSLFKLVQINNLKILTTKSHHEMCFLVFFLHYIIFLFFSLLLHPPSSSTISFLTQQHIQQKPN